MNLIPIEVPMTVSTDRVLVPMSVEAQPVLDMTIGATYAMSVVDDYTGAYTVTPKTTTQVLATKDLKMTDNVVVNPIPNNYGLISYNGTSITVS